MKNVQLVDASILINVIDVPFESQHRAQVIAELSRRERDGVDLILPIAAVFETAQHVQRIVEGSARRACAVRFSEVVRRTLENSLPWTFSEVAWDPSFVNRFLDQEPPIIPNLVESMTASSPEAGDLLLLAEWSLVRGNLPRRTHRVGVWTLDTRLGAIVSHLS